MTRDEGVQVEAWGPFAEGRNGLFENETLSAIGAAHGKSVAQVVLRWLVQRGIVTIPKSVHKERILENFAIWDFELGAEDMGRIAALDTGCTLFLSHTDAETVRTLGGWRIHD